MGSEVSIDIYLDRLEIISSGGMLSGETLKIKNHSAIPSERRNPYLADIFARMKFMERRGSGLNKIIDKTNDLFENKDSHVEYISLTNYFKVIIFNSNYKVDKVKEAVDAVNDTFDAVKDANDAVNDAFDVDHDAVNAEMINIIKKYPGLRAPLIYDLIKQNNPNITINTIRNRIRRDLKDKIIFKGNSRTGGYYIKKQKRQNTN